MNLLASSCCLVSSAAVGKAIEIWAARRQFRRVDEGQFAASLILATCMLQALAEFGGSDTTVKLSWVLLVRDCKCFGPEQEGGGRKSAHGGGVDMVTGLTTIF